MDHIDDDDAMSRDRSGDGEDGDSSSSSDDEDADIASKRNANDDESDSDEEEDDDGYDSDTQIVRIAESAASFARYVPIHYTILSVKSDARCSSPCVCFFRPYVRRCIASGECSKALVALQSVIEVTEPPSTAYAHTVLLLAQMFQLTEHFETSLACMMTWILYRVQDVYMMMPAPYTSRDGMLIIARLYELSNAPDRFAAFWRRRRFQCGDPGKEEWEAFATRCFDQKDYVFAFDAYAETFRRYYSDDAVALEHLSNAFMYRYLSCAVHVLKTSSADYKLERQQLAWRLARICCHQASALYGDRYGDVEFYNLRTLYFASFRSIYDAVFAWDDAPACAISQWWRQCCERHRLRLEQQRKQEEEAKGSVVASPPASSTAKRLKKKKDTPPATCIAQIRAQTLRRAELLRSPAKKSRAPIQPSPPKAKSPGMLQAKRIRSIPKRTLLTEKKDKQATQHACTAGSSSPAQSSNQIEGSEMQLTSPPAARVETLERHASSSAARRGGRTAHEGEYYENSPTKRRLSAVRHFRNKTLSDDLPVVVPAKSPRDGDAAVAAEDGPRSGTLLDVYSVREPTAATFMESSGRSPGFADLDLEELERYVRVAHYRARVLVQKHVDVEQLDAERVKPQWLLAFEKTMAMIVDLEEHSHSKQDATTTHLTHIHSRVLFQLTAILKSYKQAFGDTLFTRQLHSLIQKLSTWKYDQIPAILAALETTKATGIKEEKQRNLEFYHVHEGRQHRHHLECADASKEKCSV